MLAAEDFRNTKIRNFQMTLVRHQQVLQLNISMSDAVIM
jgi:hypothetical protein